MDKSHDSASAQEFAFKQRFLHGIKNPLVISLIVIFLLSGGSSAYILFYLPATSSSLPRAQVSTKNPQPTPTQQNQDQTTPADSPVIVTDKPTAGVDATTDWKTFINTNYGYSIKYPGDWIANNSGALDLKTPNFAVFNPNTSSSSARNITISYTTRTSAELNAIYGDPSSGARITINNLSATQYNRKNSDGDKSVSIVMPLTTNTLIFYALDQYQSTLLQMLGTFMLLN